MDTIEVTPVITWGPSDFGGPSIYGYAGKVRLWSISYVGQDRYSLRCGLPGIKDNVIVADQDKGKKRAERQLTAFLKLLGQERES